MEVMDPIGRVLLEVPVKERIAIVEIPAQEWATGVYLAGVHVEGLLLGTTKFQVTR